LKILVKEDSGGSYFVRRGWGNAFTACGHQVQYLTGQPTLDVFNQFEPDIFLGTTYGVDRAQIKAIASRPNLKVALFCSAHGPIVSEIDLAKYPIDVAKAEELDTIKWLKDNTGQPEFIFMHNTLVDRTMGGWRELGVKPVSLLNAADTTIYNTNAPIYEEDKCDVGWVGNFWSYKSPQLMKLVTFCSEFPQYSTRIFGTGWPLPNCLGQISREREPSIYRAAKVCLNLSEPHSILLNGYDIVERFWKTMACYSFVLTDYCQETTNILGKDWYDEFSFKSYDEMVKKIEYYVGNNEARSEIVSAQYHMVMRSHTYIHRVASIFEHFGLSEESENCLKIGLEKGLCL
jgi:hypothetical protein